MKRNFPKIILSYSKRHSGHLWQSGANYIRQFLGFAISMILARLLLPQAFGEYAYAASIAHLIMLPTMWNFGMVLLADHGKTDGLFEELTGVSWLITLLRLISLSIVCVVLLTISNPRIAILCFLTGLPLVPNELTSILKSDLEGKGNFRPTFLATLVEIGTSTICIVGLAVWLRSAFALALPGMITWTAKHVIYQVHSSRRIPFSLHLTSLRKHIKTGFWLWLSGASQDGFTRIDKTFGGMFFSSTSLGLYSRAFNFSPISHLFLSSFLTNPSVSALARRNAISEQKRYLLKVSIIVISGGIINIIFWQLFADPVILFLFGNEWLPSAPYFRSFSSLSLCYAVTYIPITLMLSIRKYQTVAFANIIGFVTLIALLFVFNTKVSPISLAIIFQIALLSKSILPYIHMLKYFRSKLSLNVPRTNRL